MKINKLNKKAAANAGTSTTAQKNRADSFRLSDIIKVLYRYLMLNNAGKFYVKTAVDAAYRFN